MLTGGQEVAQVAQERPGALPATRKGSVNGTLSLKAPRQDGRDSSLSDGETEALRRRTTRK